MPATLRSILILTVLAALTASASLAADRRPLLQAGKKTLYERVITHPGAKLFAGPDQNAQVVKGEVKTFTAMYVYARQGERLEVGVSSSAADGWIDAAVTTPWPQAITMLFTDRSSRSPVLFFRDHQALLDTCTDDAMPARLDQFLAAFAASKKGQPLDPNLPVVACEPLDSEGTVAAKRFYIMPVLHIDKQFQGTQLIEVACIDPGSAEAKTGGPLKPQNAAPQDLRSAVAFVIDTTISMQPYIEQTLGLVRTVYDALARSPHRDKVAFAVVAFRNSTRATPGLVYTSQVISDFRTVTDRASLEAALASVREATVSSHAFDEDSMAGVHTAVGSLSWKDYFSRVMLLVSDAGPIPGGDPLSATHMEPQDVADLLHTNRIWLTAVHLRTPNGRRDHPYAEQAYKNLARRTDGLTSYLPINAATPQIGAADFARVGQTLATSCQNLVEATAEGRLLDKPKAEPEATTPEERARQIAAATGYAMQLEFLGTKRQNKAPSVVSAWIADADLPSLANGRANPPLAVQPAVLLTKNQLSDLSKRLKIILDEANASLNTGSENFFQNIISATAQLTRDPSQFSNTPGHNLAQTGVLGEYLNDLPYKSDILVLTESDWYNKSNGERVQFIDGLNGKIARYDEYDKDVTNWESFGSPNAGDWVYRVPLSALP